MYGATRDELQATLAEIRDAGLFKDERELSSPQAARVRANGREVLNFCANNYLGLADHPRIVAAAKAALDEWGFGMASVRFICGTQTQHTELEAPAVAVPAHRGRRSCSPPASTPTAECSRFCSTTGTS